LPAAAQHAYGSYDELLEDYFERGWTDGLPVVPPTPAKVEQFLAAAGLRGDEVIGAVPTREVVVSAEQVAINAVMAGCRPEYMPVVLAATRAHLAEKGNCHSTTGTLSGAAQAVIVNGPVRRELGIECGSACFGPGFRANATIGRALRLVVRNVCRAIPGVLDRASFSNAMRYSFCFGEDEEASSWTPLHVERGFAPQDSAVTVASCFYLLPATDFTSRTPEGICDSILKLLKRQGVASDRWLGDGNNVVLVVGPEHLRYLVAAGWTKGDVRSYLWARFFEDGRNTVGLGRPEGMLIAAAGGPGMAETWVLFPHLAWAITEKVETRRNSHD
jgi:hypothetical protein